MIMPVAALSLSDAVRIGAEIFQTLKGELKAAGELRAAQDGAVVEHLQGAAEDLVVGQPVAAPRRHQVAQQQRHRRLRHLDREPAAALTGRATWLLLFGGLGYLAGSQWPRATPRKVATA